MIFDAAIVSKRKKSIPEYYSMECVIQFWLRRKKMISNSNRISIFQCGISQKFEQCTQELHAP